MPPGPWSGALACALYKQEAVVRATVEALFEIFAEKSSPGLKFGVEKLTELWNHYKMSVEN